MQIQFADGGSWVLRGKLRLIELMLGQCTPSEALVLYIKVEEVGEVGCGGTSLVTQFGGIPVGRMRGGRRVGIIIAMIV